MIATAYLCGFLYPNGVYCGVGTWLGLLSFSVHGPLSHFLMNTCHLFCPLPCQLSSSMHAWLVWVSVGVTIGMLKLVELFGDRGYHRVDNSMNLFFCLDKMSPVAPVALTFSMTDDSSRHGTSYEATAQPTRRITVTPGYCSGTHRMMRQRQASSSTQKVAFPVNGEYRERRKKGRSFSIPSVKAIGFTFFAFAVLFVARYKSPYHEAGKKNEMKGYVMKTPPEKFTRVPEGHRKTFWSDGGRISFPMVRALREHGWIKVNDWEDAQIVYQYKASSFFFEDLKPWQRFGHVPRYGHWNNKDEILDGFKDYQAETGSELWFLPESYRLTVPEDVEAFKESLFKRGGMSLPWVLKRPRVNQGKGIEMIPPNSPRLLEVTDSETVEEEAPDYGYIIQRYICNELTWNKRKFDVRMFWLVASIDPVVVLYHDGYVRIGNSDYNEENFDNTVSHLTTHTGLGEEGKATYDEFCEHITKHHRASPELRHIRDPVQHVKNQFKDALAEFIEAFSESSFSHPGENKLVPENGFGFYGADFILDSDLDVWFIEPQKGCGMDEDYNFRVDMHNQLFSGVVDTLEEIWIKQEEGNPVLPLENTGGWEIIYGDGWRFKYEGYERSKNKAGCDNTKGQRNSKQRSLG